MARQFGSYSPVVPLGTTWEESIELTDDDGTPIDLTGYAVRAQLRRAVPEVDPDTGLALTAPLLEITTPGYYATAPAWPTVEGWSVPHPADDGTMLLAVAAADTWTASPDNSKTKLVWDVRLVNSAGYVIPVVNGKVVFLPASTV